VLLVACEGSSTSTACEVGPGVAIEAKVTWERCPCGGRSGQTARHPLDPPPTDGLELVLALHPRLSRTVPGPTMVAMVRWRSVTLLAVVALTACGDEGVTSGTGDGASQGSSGSLATTEAADESSGGDDGPSMACSDEVPTFVDPLRVIGSDEPGLSGLVSLVATETRV